MRERAIPNSVIAKRMITMSGTRSANSTATAPRSSRRLPCITCSLTPASRSSPIDGRRESGRNRSHCLRTDLGGGRIELPVDGAPEVLSAQDDRDGDQGDEQRVLGRRCAGLAPGQVCQATVDPGSKLADTNLHVRVGLQQHPMVHLLPAFGVGRCQTSDGDAQWGMTIGMRPTVVPSMMAETFDEQKDADFSFSWEDKARFRASAFVQRGAKVLSLRLIPFQIPSFEELGLPAVIERFV